MEREGNGHWQCSGLVVNRVRGAGRVVVAGWGWRLLVPDLATRINNNCCSLGWMQYGYSTSLVESSQSGSSWTRAMSERAMPLFLGSATTSPRENVRRSQLDGASASTLVSCACRDIACDGMMWYVDP